MTAGDEAAAEVPRPRPTEKYWTDYEDWKVRRPPARAPNPATPRDPLPAARAKKPVRLRPREEGGRPPPRPDPPSSRF